MQDFLRYAQLDHGLAPDPLMATINPTIIEERPLNVAQLDVFSRLMMDRIIFLGTAVDDYVANVIQAQLLYLDSVDNRRRRERARELAERRTASTGERVTPTNIALAYVLHQPYPSFAVVGPRFVSEWRSTLSVASIRLTPAEAAYLDLRRESPD